VFSPVIFGSEFGPSVPIEYTGGRDLHVVGRIATSPWTVYVPVVPAWSVVLVWWLAFAGAHLVLSSRALRPILVRRLGAQAFQGMYSLVVLVLFVLLVRAWWPARHSGPLLWSLAAVPGVHGLAVALAFTGIAVVGLSFFQPSPVIPVPGLPTGARGLTRITRHPLFVGLALWGIAHTLVNGYLADVVFFGGFAIFSLVGGLHQDSRRRAEDGTRLRAFYDETSVVPFGAILGGRNRLVLREIPVVGVLVGIALAAALYTFHDRLFG
jgi:uncharacterized membrane protein